MSETKELELKGKDFAKISHKELVLLFKKHRNISVYVGEEHRLDLAYLKSYYTGVFNIQYADVILFAHVRRLPKFNIEEDEEERYITVAKVLFSPLEFSKAVELLQEYYLSLRDNRILNIENNVNTLKLNYTKPTCSIFQFN